MKKLFCSILLMAFALSLNACTDGKPISFQQLPQNAQTIINQHFGQEMVMLVKLDREGMRAEYEVKLKDGSDMEFDSKGNLTKIDCKQSQVPDGLVPENVVAYVKTNYPDAFITEWAKDDLRWKAELNNSLELVFNKNGEFLRYDD